MLINKIHDVDLKIYGSLTDTKFFHVAKKSVIHFKLSEYSSLLVRQRQNVILTKLYHLIIFFDKINCIVGVACVFNRLF